jgi:hypothetical protein
VIRPVEVRQSYLVISISDEGELGGIGKLIQRGYKFVFHKNFPIPTFIRSIPSIEVQICNTTVPYWEEMSSPH